MATHYPVTSGVRHAHPIHGILAAYPLAFFTGALATDLIYARSADMMWADFSAWQIAAGLAMGVLASVAGITDAVIARDRTRHRRRSRPHTLVTIFMLAFGVVNAFVHSRDAWTSVVPTGLALSAITFVLALVSSWLGYSLEARMEDR